MEILWAPWRMGYVSQEREEGCFLCRKAAETEDERNLILARWDKWFALLNTFPYNNGHTLIAPYRHVGECEELDEQEILGIGEGLNRVLRALKAVLRPDGFNVGLNLGEAAGRERRSICTFTWFLAGGRTPTSCLRWEPQK